MEKVRIQDDLYLHVNQETIDNLVIPDDMPATGGFTTLALEVEKLMMGEFDTMCKTRNYPNVHLERACALYRAAKNVKKKDADGIKPAIKHLAIIESLESMADFNRQLKKLVLNRLPLPFDISVNEDMKDTEHYLVYIQGPGVILPDASYYKPEMADTKQALIGMWTNMAKLVLQKTELTDEEQDKYIADTLAFDELLGGLVKTSEEWSEYVKMYNPTKTGRVCNLVKPVAMRKLLRGLFGELPQTIVVTEPRFFNNFKQPKWCNEILNITYNFNFSAYINSKYLGNECECTFW